MLLHWLQLVFSESITIRQSSQQVVEDMEVLLFSKDIVYIAAIIRWSDRFSYFCGSMITLQREAVWQCEINYKGDEIIVTLAASPPVTFPVNILTAWLHQQDGLTCTNATTEKMAYLPPRVQME